MNRLRLVLRALGSYGATQNAMAVLEAHQLSMAEVDNVVARLHRHAVAHEPAA